MYRKLAWQGGEPREVAEIVNNLVEGKSNNTGVLTLNTGNATTTTLYDERIGFNSVILFTPLTETASVSNLPYGAFSDYTNHTIASTTTAYPLTFNTTDSSNGCYIGTPASRLYVRNTGIYNFQWSGQLSSLDNAPQDAFVWIRINGTDAVGSTGLIGMPARKNPSDPFHAIYGWNFLLTLNAGDYIELVWSATSTALSIDTYAAGTSPTKPSTASLVGTLQYVSSVSGATQAGLYVSNRQKGQATINHFSNTDANKKYSYIIVG